MVSIEAVKYDDINKCMAAFFNCEPDELESLEGNFEMLWGDGKEESWDIQTAITDIRKGACWGWLEDKRVLHYYISARATLSQVIKMFGHELGHMQRPFHRSLKEEQKADKYGSVVVAAYEIAVQAMEQK